MTLIQDRPVVPTHESGAIDPRPFFVYGTLRSGQPLHSAIADLCPVVAPAVLRGWVLVGAGEPYPMIVPTGRPHHAVVGETLTFAEADYPEARARLDQIEGVPHLYVPAAVRVIVDGSTESQALAYEPTNLRRARQQRPVPGGDWVAYTEQRKWF